MVCVFCKKCSILDFSKLLVTESKKVFHNTPLPLHRRVLQCCTPVSPHLPWSSSESQWLDSLLFPYGTNVTMLQDSLYVTDCYFAPVSHRHTSLQHNQSPKSIGGSLQGSLAITLTRLSLAS